MLPCERIEAQHIFDVATRVSLGDIVYVLLVSLSNAHALYTIRLGLELNINNNLYICLSVGFQFVSTHSLKHELTYFASNEIACQLLLIGAFIF